MPDNQTPSFERTRQHDDQARQHAVQLFAVAMREKEASLFIHQQLVQTSFQLIRRQSELLRDRQRRTGDGCVPFVAKSELPRIEFEGIANLRIDQRPRPLPIGSDAAARDQRLRFSLLQRDRDRPESLDFETGVDHGQATRHTKSGRSGRLFNRFRQPLDGG